MERGLYFNILFHKILTVVIYLPWVNRHLSLSLSSHSSVPSVKRCLTFESFIHYGFFQFKSQTYLTSWRIPLHKEWQQHSSFLSLFLFVLTVGSPYVSRIIIHKDNLHDYFLLEQWAIQSKCFIFTTLTTNIWAILVILKERTRSSLRVKTELQRFHFKHDVFTMFARSKHIHVKVWLLLLSPDCSLANKLLILASLDVCVDLSLQTIILEIKKINHSKRVNH